MRGVPPPHLPSRDAVRAAHAAQDGPAASEGRSLRLRSRSPDRPADRPTIADRRQAADDDPRPMTDDDPTSRRPDNVDDHSTCLLIGSGAAREKLWRCLGADPGYGRGSWVARPR